MSKNAAEMTDDELEEAENAVSEESSEESTEGTGTTTATEGEQQEGTTAASTGEEETSQEQGTNTATTTEQAEAQTSAVAEQGKVAGVASKDGTRVLPYSALQAERRSARQASARAERAEAETQRLKQEIEDLRSGKSKDSDKLTEEEVQRMEAEFPAEGKKLRAVFERTKELEQQVAAAKPEEPNNEDVGDDPTQEAIDQVPLLVEWQHDPKHADKWERAIAIDNALQGSPKWKSKPPVERFEHVAAMVADEFDIEAPAKTPAVKQSSTAKPSTASTDPKKVAEKATRQPPSTLSDMKGGAVPDHGQVSFEKMAPQTMLSRFMDMTPDEMDRHLAKLG